jgi:5-formyltetrahydrofolate cyclo-ligase
MATPAPALTWDEVRRWRKAERARLIEARVAIDRDKRQQWHAAITQKLTAQFPFLPERVVGFYWPFRGEFDARPLMRELHRQGTRLALPVVVEKATPLQFREWRPGIRMVPGIWQIPVPADSAVVTPTLLLVPLVGFDPASYRLGYGGGYYDRTLAAIRPRPLAIGIGFEQQALATIHPQPHDIPMDYIVTEARVARREQHHLVSLS